jgi:hypothetical protein
MALQAILHPYLLRYRLAQSRLAEDRPISRRGWIGRGICQRGEDGGVRCIPRDTLGEVEEWERRRAGEV